MSAQPSTIRASDAPTVEQGLHSDESLATAARVLAFWHEQRNVSALKALEAFPSLAENKSLFLDLVLEEYQLQRHQRPAVDIHSFCQQFEPLGSLMNRSILRALEVQEYLDCHPELLQLVTDFEWPAVGDSLQGFHVIEELGAEL